ncbi:MAG TPA: 50S ribosomal protein L4 [Desulfuromonadales bacterium]|nr:50S ribosomal protein L4 [Desulfuromonadales bacterium]
MAKIVVYDMNRKQVSERDLVEEVFNTDVKEYLLHDMVRYQLAARRQGTAKTKGRGEVRGGGKKPYRQKGTGNARQGTTTAPNHVGGGVVFGPTPRDYKFKLNRKVKQSALRSALSARYKEECMTVVNGLDLEQISTKGFAEVLDRFELKKALIVVDGENTNLELSARNLPFIKVLRAEGVNVYDILKYPNLVMTEAAIDQIEGVLAK